MKVKLRKSLDELEEQSKTLKMIEETVSAEMAKESTLIKE